MYSMGPGWCAPPAVTELLEQAVRAAAVLGLLICFLPQYPERAAGLIVAGMVVCEVFSALTLTVLYHSRLGDLRRQGPGEPGQIRRRRILSIALPVGANALLGNLMGGGKCHAHPPGSWWRAAWTVGRQCPSWGWCAV